MVTSSVRQSVQLVMDGEAIQAVITTVMPMVHTTMAIHRIMLAALISTELVIIGLNNLGCK